MSPIYRLQSLWTGFQGAPGYTNLYFGASAAPDPGELQPWADAVGDFWTALEPYLPNVVNIKVQEVAEVVETTTGQPTGQVAITSPAAAKGSGGTTYSAPTGAHINWLTGIYLEGRQFRGRTYLVPLAFASYDTDGTISSSALSGLQAAVLGLLTAVSPNLIVYSRPKVGGGAGHATAVIQGVVPDQASVLRSRRD